MEIKRKSIKVRDLVEGYVNDSEYDIEKGVYAYGGKLCVRPSFQRSFVYNKEQENAVINTVLNGFPLNIMYWVENEDGTYDCIDGQQRTISLCNFADGTSSFNAPWLNENKKTYVLNLEKFGISEKFYDYELEVYICKGTKLEQLDWFKTINIAGEKLYPQELRNASYVSPWLTDAKKYFSKASAQSNAKCPAERIGGEYTNKNANRQEILEQVISWAIGSNNEEDICAYMADHMNDENAKELWDYFNNVIDWIKELFPGTYDKGMKTVNWGVLYNNYHDEDLDPEEICDTFNKLIEFKSTKELDVSVAKIIECCITKDEKLLKPRAFSDVQKTAMYNKQEGICPICGQHYRKPDMQAHHIIPWYDNGITEISNGVLLCNDCHKALHAGAISFDFSKK